MNPVRLSRVSRPEADGFGGTISEYIEEAYRQQLRRVQYTGFALSATFFLLMIASIFVAIRYPAFFGIVAVCR